MTHKFSAEILQFLDLNDKNASVVPVSRASFGLIAVLCAWRKRNHGDCIVGLPGAVCHDVLAAVIESGCKPLFCDVDPDTGIVTEKEWIRIKSIGVSVVIAVHLYGNFNNIQSIRKIFPSPKYLIIDDAAQALGTKYKNMKAGACGDVGLLSFGETKHIELGCALLVIKDHTLWREIINEITKIKAAKKNEITRARTIFRDDFYYAMNRLRKEEDKSNFNGLLDGYSSALYPPLMINRCLKISKELESLPILIEQRKTKTALWKKLLQDSNLIPVGMMEDAVPWRYTCRLPGIRWREQHILGDKMRSEGINVSHWYIPANWFVNDDLQQSKLSGVEVLSREVFQFWIDKKTSINNIYEMASVVNKTLTTSGIN